MDTSYQFSPWTSPLCVFTYSTPPIPLTVHVIHHTSPLPLYCMSYTTPPHSPYIACHTPHLPTPLILHVIHHTSPLPLYCMSYTTPTFPYIACHTPHPPSLILHVIYHTHLPPCAPWFYHHDYIIQDSTLLVSCSADKNLRIWGLDFGDCHKSIFAHEDSITCVSFVPDTHLLFSGSKDASIKCWDADNFQHILTLKVSILYMYPL